jgi:hypothetical protein
MTRDEPPFPNVEEFDWGYAVEVPATPIAMRVQPLDANPDLRLPHARPTPQTFTISA